MEKVLNRIVLDKILLHLAGVNFNVTIIFVQGREMWNTARRCDVIVLLTSTNTISNNVFNWLLEDWNRFEGSLSIRRRLKTDAGLVVDNIVGIFLANVNHRNSLARLASTSMSKNDHSSFFRL